MNVAITGVSGYLGRQVAGRLAWEAEVDAILGLDIVAPREALPNTTFRYADMRHADFATLLHGVDVLYHLAFIVQPPRRMPMALVDETNVEGSRRVFEGAVAAGVRKIVYSSSIAAYGAHPDNPPAMTEDAPLRPNQDWYYSRTKGRVEAMLDELQRRHPDLVIVRLRPGIFLGPTVDNTMGRLYSAPVVLSLDDRTRIHFSWDADIAEAFGLALHHDRSDVFNLAGDSPVTAAEIARATGKRVLRVPRGALLAVARAACATRLLPRADLEWLERAMTHSITVSSRKAREVLGWRPRLEDAAAVAEFARTRPARRRAR